MGGRIIAVCSSPRRTGTTAALMEQVAAGAREAGCEVESVQLSSKRIGPCRGCQACQADVDTACVQHDDMGMLLGEVREADGLVLASPIYFAGVNAQMKSFVDRLYALFGAGSWDTLRGKSCALAFTHYNVDPLRSGPMSALHMFQDMFGDLGVNLVGWVHACTSDAGGVTAVSGEAVATGARLAEACLGWRCDTSASVFSDLNER